MTPARLEQWTGCLLGQCLGDALGAPVEGRPPELCQPYIDEVLATGQAGRGRGDRPFGQYTDDSQLARELLQSFAACGRFAASHYAGRIAALFAEQRIVGCGRATLEAAERLQRGVPWDQAGTRPPAAGNGTAMRAGPVGLLFASDPDALCRAAHEQGYITHQDPRCSAGSVAIAGAVALALRPGAPQPGPFLQQLAAWAGRYDASVAAALGELASYLDLPPSEAVTRVGALTPAGQGSEQWRGISPFVTTSVVWSLYAFLRTPASYLETMRTAIAVGGDVDTTAAMAGAISGAHLGQAALPPALLAQLHDNHTWDADDLAELAERCYHLCQPRPRSLWRRLLGRG